MCTHSMCKQLLDGGRLAQRRAAHPLQQVGHLLPLRRQALPASTQLRHELVQQGGREADLWRRYGRGEGSTFEVGVCGGRGLQVAKHPQVTHL